MPDQDPLHFLPRDEFLKLFDPSVHARLTEKALEPGVEGLFHMEPAELYAGPRPGDYACQYGPDKTFKAADLFQGLTARRLSEYRGPLYSLFESEFGVRYDAMPLDDRNPEYGSDERGYAWGWLQEVADFFQRAARERRHVVFTVRF